MKTKILVLSVITLAMFTKVISQSCTGYPSGTTFYNSSGTYIVTSGTYGGGVFYVTSDLEISSNVNFTDAALVMSANVKITVKSNGNLTLSGCRLFACGSTMWKGIVIEYDPNATASNNGTLTVKRGSGNDCSVIEDAEKAIQMNNGSSFTTSTSGHINQLDVSNTIFNKNYIGIEMDNYAFLSTGTGYNNFISTNYQENVYAVSIINCIFTCRNIAVNPSSTSNLTGLPHFIHFKEGTGWTSGNTFPNTPIVLSNPYIDESTYPSTGTGSTLKSPYSGQKSDIGISINPSSNSYNDNGHYELGEPKINSATNDWNTNIFDNQRLGIRVADAHISIRNSTFQNLVFKSQTYDAIGILAINLYEAPFYIDVSNTSSTPTPSNAFFDCNYAIKTENYPNVTVKSCDIRNNKNGSGVLNGEHGIDITTWQNVQLDVSANNIYNIGTGVSYKMVGPYWYPAMLYIPDNPIDVYDNIFGDKPTSINTGTFNSRSRNLAVDFGITIGSLATNPSLVATSSSNYYLRCANNTVAAYNNGIQATGFEDIDIRILNNNIVLTNETGYHFGIRVEDCIAHRVNTNNTPNGYFSNTTDGNFIYNNSISYGGGGCSSCNRAGIDVYGGDNFNINCNTVADNKYGIKVNGNTKPSTEVFNNTFTNTNTYGLCLAYNGSYGGGGFIGDQGDNGKASDNQWTGTWGSGQYATLCDASDATASPLYVQNGVPTYDPNLYSNFGTGPGAVAYGTSGSLFNSNSNGYDCSSNPITWRPRTTKIPVKYNTKPLDEIALGTLKLATTDFKVERLFVMQLQLYKSLLGANRAMTQQSNTLNEFVDNPPQGIKIIVLVEEQLRKANKELTKKLLDSWQPHNLVEENYKQYYSWQITKPNIDALYTLAQQCPLTNGAVVNYARTLYNALTQKNIVFENNCGASSELLNNNLPLTVDLYPNPTKGFVKVNCDNAKQIDIVNIQGQLLISKPVFNASNTLAVDKLSAGIYLVRVTTSNNKIVSTKLVIE